MRHEWKTSGGTFFSVDSERPADCGPLGDEILRLAAALKTADERIALLRSGNDRLARETKRYRAWINGGEAGEGLAGEINQLSADKERLAAHVRELEGRTREGNPYLIDRLAALEEENRRLHFGLAAARTENDSLRADLTRRGREILALQGEKAALFAGRFPEVATRIQALEEEVKELRPKREGPGR